jgi:hypothetical protein
MEITVEDYGHPATHPPEIITQDSDNRFVTDAQIAAWDAASGADGSAAAAAASAAEALTSETNAAASEVTADGSKIAAELAATNAQVSETNAAGSAVAAAASETAAGTATSKTTAELEDIADTINITGKGSGRFVFNSTTGLMVYASGALAADTWKTFDGVVAHTPI